MTKESPWFKFKVTPYITGDIQAVSYHLKGVFADLMAYYWSRHCKMTYKQACKKFKSTNIDALVEADIIKQRGDNVNIDFLDEQWQERQKTVSTNSSNGSAGAIKRWGKSIAEPSRPDGEPIATAMRLDSDTIANKKEKENKKENEIEKASPSNKPPLIEIFWTDLPNSSFFQTACNDLARPKEELIAKLAEFKKARRTDYKNMQELADHFKFWINKQEILPTAAPGKASTFKFDE